MPERLAPMVLLATWCAMRDGELIEQRRSDIRIIGLPKSEAGTREVTMPPHVIPAIEAHLSSKHLGNGDEPLLFPPDRGEVDEVGRPVRLQPSTLYRHFYKARAAAKRTDLRFHDLRHTGATLAVHTGATLADLMVRIGHSTP